MEELYTKEFLLNRAFEKMENISKKKFSMKKPEIKNQNRKTFIKNFQEMCQSINRDEEHLKVFIDKELKLRKSSSINEDNMLMINGTIRQGPIENIIARYAQKYIICGEPKCNSGNTKIVKESRITYLACNSCGSRKAID